MKPDTARGALLLALILLTSSGLGPAAPNAASAAPPRQEGAGPVRWGFFITYNPNSWVSLQANARYLTHVSPWLYNLNAAGQVGGRERPDVAALLKSVGAKSLPMLKNTPQYDDFSAIISDPNRQDDIVNQVDSLIDAYSYDGITIDFEGLNPGDKPALTAFMSRLYERLHPKGKLVAMAVAAKVKEISSGWAAVYDYPALANVVDYLLVMAYDYHWATGDPGPIAPMNKLVDTANYAVARVPASRLLWGVGVYGYDWGRNPDGTPDGEHAEYRTFAEATAIGAAPGAQSGYEDATESPWVKYDRDSKPREIWYENNRSFQAKLDIIARYGMAGFAIWRLGQEDPAIWDTIAAGRPAPKPAACDPVPPPDPASGRVFFAETGHTLGGAFLSYWRTRGGLPVFGFPLTEEFAEKSPTDGKTYTVQYFERNRFEFHPENSPPNDVLLGLLGAQLTKSRSFPPAGDPKVSPETVYFPQVAHTLSNPFLAYWAKNGGLAQFGYPISEPVIELSKTDGKTYTVQYFERARFEYHPEYRGTSAEVLLGLLGLDVSPCR
jgi:spore germination protein YaaH